MAGCKTPEKAEIHKLLRSRPFTALWYLLGLGGGGRCRAPHDRNRMVSERVDLQKPAVDKLLPSRSIGKTYRFHAVVRDVL